MKIFLLSILGLLVLIALVVAIFAKKNAGQMNACVDETIQRISTGHTLTETQNDTYSEMHAYGILTFHVKQYDIENVGNLSVMTVNAGVMQMATVVFSPFEKDLPLMSCDYMYMLSNRKAYIELYDLVKEKDDIYLSWMEKYKGVAAAHTALPDCTASSGWYDHLITTAIYKQTKPGDDAELRAMLGEAVDVYLAQADAYDVLSTEDKAQKIDRIKAYSDRLIDEGGVSTNFFKQALGEEVTRDFFDKVFFGTEQYR